MAVPRVSAFAIYKQLHQETTPQVGLKKKKNKGAISKTSHKLIKKKRGSSVPIYEAALNSYNVLQEESGQIPSNKKRKPSSRKEKKLCTPESTGKPRPVELSVAILLLAATAKQIPCLDLKYIQSNAGHTLVRYQALERNCKHVGPPLHCVLQELGKVQNSKDRATALFEWFISPISSAEFFRNMWERKPALIRRHNTKYYDGFFSTAEFDRILREDNVQFDINLDVTSYTDGVRETHNPSGRALPMVVWDYYNSGCSLRLLNPQAFSVTVWNVLCILQELFGSMAGANMYLTPPGTQGFAPHYDDIEAFVIQLEGKKHWRVYNPRDKSEILPQFSSANFTDHDIGEPILETVLEAGDLLYFPRGFIHQGDCLPDVHSLHITVSTFQRNCWADLLEKLLPAALQIAAEEDVEYRKGLPLDYLEYMGVQNADLSDPRRSDFIEKVHKLMRKLTEYAPVDAAVDQKAKAFLHDCLPPVLTPAERDHSVYGAPVRWEHGHVKDCAVQLERDTKIRFLRGGVARLCSEGDACVLYYSTDNSRVYHKEEPKSIDIDAEDVDAVEYLLRSYPAYVTVEDLPREELDSKLALANMLFEKGLLITKT